MQKWLCTRNKNIYQTLTIKIFKFILFIKGMAKKRRVNESNDNIDNENENAAATNDLSLNSFESPTKVFVLLIFNSAYSSRSSSCCWYNFQYRTEKLYVPQSTDGVSQFKGQFYCWIQWKWQKCHSNCHNGLSWMQS